MLTPGGHVEVSKTPEQIRDEAAKNAAADLAALLLECGIRPSEEAKLQTATGLFIRHREEIRAEATSIHFHGADEPCPSKTAEPDATKLS